MSLLPVLGLLIGAAALSQAATRDELRSLQGVRSFRLSVSSPFLGAAHVEALRRKIAGRLGEAGLGVFEKDQEQQAQARFVPQLHVELAIERIPMSKQVFVVRAVCVRQPVALDRDPAVAAEAVTWDRLSSGVLPLSGDADMIDKDVEKLMAQHLSAMIDQLAADTISVNPRQHDMKR